MAEPIFAAFVDGKPILLSVEQLRAMLGVVDVPALPPSSDALAAVVDVANAAARETMASVALAFDRADAIEIDTAALKDARAVLDAAVQELRDRGTVADAALRALDALAVDGEAARRQIERDAGRLSAASLQMLLVANRTQEILRDAGIIVDQASGRVYIYAVDQLGGRVNAVSQTLDAQAAQIRTKASSNEVDEKILRAVLNPEQIAQLEPLIARIAAVEVVTDGLRAEVATRASLVELTAAVGRITDVEQLASATDGLVRSKVSQTAFDAAMVRLGSAELALQAYGDVSRYAIELRQARAVAADTSRGLLASILAGDAATIREITAQGDLRQELYSKITGVGSDLAVEVRARTTLVATVAAMDARSVQDRLTFSKADQALAQDIDALGVRSGTQELAIATLQRASLTQAGGIAGIETAIRQQARGSSDADQALLAGVIAGDEAARRANNSLAEVQVQLTTTMLAGFDASAVARQALRARINDADARFATETKATADRFSAVTQSLTTLEASFGAQSGDIAAAKAEIARLEKVAADDKAATLQLIEGLRAAINDPATGLPKTRADLTALTELVATQNGASARRLDSLEAALFDDATGLAATSARLDREVTLSADRDGARGRQIEALSGTVNDPTTGLPGAFAGIATERDARVKLGEAQASLIEGLRAIINDAATGLPAVNAGLVTERDARVAAGEAQARETEGLRAIVNDPSTGLPWARAEIGRVSEAVATEQEVRARAIEALTVKLGDLGEATVADLIEAVVKATGEIMATRTIAIDINGNWVGVQLVGSQDGPGRFNLVNVDLTMGAGRIIFDNAGFMWVMGIGFGVGGKLIDWYGPKLGSIAQCSIDNAIAYKTNDGRSGFRGAVGDASQPLSVSSQQVGQNQLSSPAWAKSGAVTRINASFSWTNNGSRDSASGNIVPEVTLVLYRKLGNNPEVEVARVSGPGSGAYSDTSRPVEFFQSVDGTLTYADTEQTAETRIWRLAAALTANVPPGGASRPDTMAQSMTITATPQ